MSPSPSAPQAAEILAQVERAYGFVPNVLRELSTSPAALQVYVAGQNALAQGTLSPAEQQAVQIAVAAFNECQYCQTAHSWVGKKAGLSPEDIEAIKAGGRPTDQAVAAVVAATRAVLDRRGWLDPEALSRLEQEGASRAKLYEVIAFIGLKTISNYVNHMAHTPLDEVFQS